MKSSLRVIVIVLLSLLLAVSLTACGGGGDDGGGSGGSGGGSGGGTGTDLVAHVEEWLRTLQGKDAYYSDLSALYAIEDTVNGGLVEVPLEPGSPVFHEDVLAAYPEILVVQDGTAYWHDGANFYWVPLSGGTVQSVSIGAYISQGWPIIDLPYIYFDEFITDSFMRINVSGGTPEEVDSFTLGGPRSMARDTDTLYWIGAWDGTYLKSMPEGGGSPTTLLSGSNNIYWPTKMKALPDGQGGTVLYWMDKLQNGNDVIRKFPVPNGPVTSIINASYIIDFAVTDDAIYWWVADYIGKFDLSQEAFTYPVDTGSTTIQGFAVNGNYLYYTISDGWVYRVPR